MPKIDVGGQLYSPGEISGMILTRLKESAEERLQDTVEGVIITVPAYFNDSQRQATKDAGEIAGLNVMRIINEPTAASLAFSLDLKTKGNILVYDLGGGTIDISVLELQDEVIKVLATAGNIKLGGNDFDMLLTRQLVAEIKEERQIDLSTDKMAMQRIRDAAENAKIELSTIDEYEINLPFIGHSDDGPFHFLRFYTRYEFEQLINDRVEETTDICGSALRSSGLTSADIDEILLVGGSSRIPYVQKRIQDYFKKSPNKKVNPDEIVAMGAAIQGAIASGISEDVLLLDVIPISLGVKTFGGAFTRIINANTTIPTNRSLVFSTAEDDQSEVEINVYQGEMDEAEKNKLLGKFTLTGVPKMEKGLPRIEVVFSIDINGILKVSATDLSTRNKKEVVVSDSGLLSRDEISEIKQGVNKLLESDLKKKELVQLKNDVVNFVYSIKKNLETPGIPQYMLDEAKQLIRTAKIDLEKENPEQLDTVCSRLYDLNTQMEIAVNQPIKYEECNDVDTAELPTDIPLDLPDTIDQSDTSKFRMFTDDPALPPPAPKSKEPELPPVAPEPIAKEVTEPDTEKLEPLLSFDEDEANRKNAEAEIKQIKQIVLHSLYNIEQYMANMDLTQTLKDECRTLMDRAHREIDKANLDNLKIVDNELNEMGKSLEKLVGGAFGLVDPEKPKAKPVKKGKKDDTRPFKIFSSD
ncbi:MAG: Hsp70 family protein [bacterium]|nr:Hsp70 family protein [bacterium]